MVDSSDNFGRRFPILIVLVTTLASFYMLTYSGRIISGDAQFLFDATSSLVQHGDLALDLSAGDRPPRSFDPSNNNPYALESVGSEPLQIILAGPLFWFASKLPGIGLVHAVWLLNVFISALAAGILFLYACSLGFRERTAIAAAWLFGLGTIIWPYSKSFFREPLALFTVLLTALLIHLWRERQYRSRWLPLAIILVGMAALLAKTTNAFAFPALIVLALPSSGRIVGMRRWLIFGIFVAAILILLFLIFSVFGDILPFVDRYDDRITAAIDRISRPRRGFPRALSGYLLSPGGSIWGTSPIVLLIVPGFLIGIRQKQRRIPLAVTLMLLTYGVGYALLRGSHWFGGLSWPPRFLVPVVPFLIIGALPAIDRAANNLRTWWGVMAGVLFAYSLWVQLSGVTLAWDQYVRLLPPESGQLIEWRDGLYNPQYWRWILIPAEWGRSNVIDFAWLRTDILLWPLMFVLVIVVGMSSLWLRPRLRKLRIAVALPLMFVVFVFVGLRVIYQDELYTGDKAALHDMLTIIDEVAQSGDVLLIDNVYVPFFLNYGKRSDIRVFGLPFQYGERSSPEQEPEVISDNPDDLVKRPTQLLIHQLADERARIWLLMGSGPFITWAVRPEERFMAAHYYPVREFVTDPTVRLIEYNTVDAPAQSLLQGAEIATTVRFDETIQLEGYTLPAGTQYAPGDVIPISLRWLTASRLERDYTVAWFVRTEEGLPVEQGIDSQPGAGFAPTSTWQPGVPVWDNRALRLPDTLEAGRYVLWLLVYYTEPDGTLIRLPVTGDDVVEAGTIAVMPTRIDVVAID